MSYGDLMGFGFLIIGAVFAIWLVSMLVASVVLGFVAKAFGAGRYSLGPCFLVVLLSSIVGGVISYVAQDIHPAIGIIGSVAVHMVMVAQFLHSRLLAAFVITLVAQFVMIVLMVALVMLLMLIVGGSSFSPSVDPQSGLPAGVEIQEGADRMSSRSTQRPDGTVETVMEITKDGQTQRIVTITGADGKVISSSIDAEASSQPEPEPEKAPVARKPSVRYEYLETLPESLVQKRGLRARITTRDGNKHEGIVQSVGDGTVKLEKRVSGGKMVFPIKLSNVRSALVREAIEE